MGLCIKCKKTGTGYYLGYGGFMYLRAKVAEANSKEFGNLYKDYFTTAPALRNAGNFVKEANKLHKNGKLSAKIWKFCTLPDIKGSVSYAVCNEIYNLVKGIKDNYIYGYAGQENPFDHNQFVKLLKECYDNKSDLIWE